MSAKPEPRHAQIDALMQAAIYEELQHERQHLGPEQYEPLDNDAQLLMLTTIMMQEALAEAAGAPAPPPQEMVATALQELACTRRSRNV